MQTQQTMHADIHSQSLTADVLQARIDYSSSGYGFIQGCLDNTRTLSDETDDVSTLLYFAMTAIGRFPKGSPAVEDFTALFEQLGREECADRVRTKTYTFEDLAFYWSGANVNPHWFEASSIEPLQNVSSAAEKRTLTKPFMAEEWTDYPFYEIDKVPDALIPQHWGLYHLDNATIIYRAGVIAVLDEDGRPVLDLCTDGYHHLFLSDVFKAHIRALSDKSRVEPEVPVLDNALMIQDSIRQPNFCHWLLDQLPRTRHLEGSQRVLMYRLAPFMETMLNKMGVASDRVLELEQNEIVCISKLTIESSMAKHFHHPCQEVNKELTAYIKNVLTADAVMQTTQPFGEYIYLSRNKFSRRRISNENDMLPLLQRYGFQTVYPEEHTIEEQIAIFNNASVIVAPHGASLANIIFCNDVTLIEIFNQNYGTPTFYLIASLLGFPYQFILGNNPLLTKDEQDEVGLAHLQTEDIEVNLDKLAQCLNKVFPGT